MIHTHIYTIYVTVCVDTQEKERGDGGSGERTAAGALRVDRPSMSGRGSHKEKSISQLQAASLRRAREDRAKQDAIDAEKRRQLRLDVDALVHRDAETVRAEEEERLRRDRREKKLGFRQRRVYGGWRMLWCHGVPLLCGVG
mgnify:CR=1 FL=1